MHEPGGTSDRSLEIATRDTLERIRLALWRRVPSTVLYRLPPGVAATVIRRQQRGRFGASDTRAIAGPDGFEVTAYWGPPGVVDGPCVSVFLEGVEVLRIDLGAAPHVHYRPTELAAFGPVLPQVEIDATGREAKVDRAVFEVQHNIRYCIVTDRRRRIRRSGLADADLASVADDIRNELHALYERHDPDVAQR